MLSSLLRLRLDDEELDPRDSGGCGGGNIVGGGTTCRTGRSAMFGYRRRLFH